MSVPVIIFTIQSTDGDTAHATIIGYTSLDTKQTMAIATVTLFDQVTPTISTEIKSEPTILCAGTTEIVGQQSVNGKPHGSHHRRIGTIVWDGVHINKPTAFQFDLDGGHPMKMQSTSPTINNVPALSLPDGGNYTGCSLTERFDGVGAGISGDGRVCVSPMGVILAIVLILLAWYLLKQV